MTRPVRDEGRDDIEAVGALAEPMRRRLYEYVAASAAPVGRDEASREVGIGRPLAAFHLDRLVDDGLLVAEYRRLTGRSGPGAGRPAKVYRRAPGEIAVSLPARQYEIAAGVFADALQRIEPSGPPEALLAAARARGRELAGRVAAAPGARAAGGIGAADGGADAAPVIDSPSMAPARKGHDSLVEALERLGFEPALDGARIRLRNCPFDALAREHRDLTCPANLALLQGLVEGADVEARPVLRPEPGYCCVVIERAGEPPPAPDPEHGSPAGDRAASSGRPGSAAAAPSVRARSGSPSA